MDTCLLELKDLPKFCYQIWRITDPHQSRDPSEQLSEMFHAFSGIVHPVQRVLHVDKAVAVDAVGHTL